MNKRIRGHRLIGVCVSWCTAALLSCPAVPVAAEQVTVSYEIAESPERTPVMRKWGEDFMKLHPIIKVEAVPQQDVEKNVVAIQGGAGPDLIISDWNALASYAGNGMAVPLDAFVQADGFDLSQFFPMPLDGYRYNGLLYALPLKVDTHVMAYNRDLFDQGGVQYPREWTWDALRSNARKLTRDTNGDGQPEQFGFGLYAFYVDGYIGWIWQNGGNVYSRVNGKVKSTYNDPKTVDAVQFLVDLMHQDQVMADPNWLSRQNLRGDQMFTASKVAAYFTGEWRLRFFNQANPLLNWDIAMVPYNAQRAIELGGIGYLINPNARHKKEAWELLKFIAAGESAQRSVIESGMGLSALKRMPPLSFPGKRIDIMLTSMNYLRKIDMFPEWSKINQSIEEPTLAKVWRAELNVKQALAEITRQSNAILGW